MFYDVKCEWCGHEDVISLPMTRDLDEDPLGCTNTNKKCPGIMVKVYKTPPTLSRTCTPTKTCNDGVKYKERK